MIIPPPCTSQEKGKALFLTVLKLAIGIITNSLGILSEVVHSGLDMVAALITFFAVRASSRPPDRDHPFGHGKVENLSALLETLLLLLNCAWIIYEAGHPYNSQALETDALHFYIDVWSSLVVVMGLLSVRLVYLFPKYRLWLLPGLS